MKTKILILGGANGFIGRNLVNYFKNNENFDVYSSWNKDLPIYDKKCLYLQADLTLKDDVKSLFNLVRPEIVLQFAAYTTNAKDVIESPMSHSTTNYIINSLVLEAAHKFGVKHFIYPSCSTMYASKEIPQTEVEWSLDTIPHCYKHVAYMKTAVERMCEAYASMGKCKYTVVRQSNIFGPHDKTNLEQAHVFASMVTKICAATDTLEIWGDGKAKRDLLYIDDLVDMIDRVIKYQQTPYEIYNCGQGKAYSILEIIQAIQEVTNKKDLKLVYNNSKPNIPTITILDTSKAKNELGWEPKISFEDGVKKTVEWYLNES